MELREGTNMLRQGVKTFSFIYQHHIGRGDHWMKEEEFRREFCKENLQFKGSRIEYIVSEGNLCIF